MKRRLLDNWKQPGDIMMFGYIAEEADRLDDFRERNTGREIILPLVDRVLGKGNCKAMVERAGILLPMQFRRGYDKANCKCCIKGGEAYGSLVGGVSLDLQQARDDATGKRLAYRAEQQFKAHLAYSTGALKVGGEWQLVGARYSYDYAGNARLLDRYSRINVSADYRLDREWTLFARANNVSDKKYELVRNYAAPRASFFVGVRYQQK
ncbi:TonB-dependent receptor domain-containing protein [Rhodocyclus gracilis]|uniref:TonB-dependent receptor n=1 Tax=Rhodocyclus tenuis TaxID=1066 RepID=A0A6L5JWV9_RHOTE|nr:TonB-dependent receptor [Rhodocyclus gracilis]MQY51292.1 TonB-dependent receptor [Rhodocyclus gracilis]